MQHATNICLLVFVARNVMWHAEEANALSTMQGVYPKNRTVTVLRKMGCWTNGATTRSDNCKILLFGA